MGFDVPPIFTDPKHRNTSSFRAAALSVRRQEQSARSRTAGGVGGHDWPAKHRLRGCRLVAVIDWRSAPKVIHTVGAACVGGGRMWSSQEYTVVIVMMHTTRLSPTMVLAMQRHQTGALPWFLPRTSTTNCAAWTVIPLLLYALCALRSSPPGKQTGSPGAHSWMVFSA